MLKTYSLKKRTRQKGGTEIKQYYKDLTKHSSFSLYISLCHIFEDWEYTIKDCLFSIAYRGEKIKIQAFTFQKKDILIQSLGQISQRYIREMQKNGSS